MAREPVIVAWDQAFPDEWMVGDIVFMHIGVQEYTMTVRSIDPMLGPNFQAKNAFTPEVSEAIKAYRKRLESRNKPTASIDEIWAAVVDFSSSTGKGGLR